MFRRLEGKFGRTGRAVSKKALRLKELRGGCPLLALSLVAAGVMAGCGGSSPAGAPAPPTPTPTPTPAPQQEIGVSGTQMTLNGAPWLSRGVTLQGFVRPLALLKTQAPTDTQAAALLNAQLNYGGAELAAIQAYHADTIRFQVSQPALDPSSNLYDSGYLNDVVTAIKQARAAGFAVLIMMQDESITGDTGESPLPTMETQNDWDLFTTAFGSDRGVMFELYNEPSLAASPTNWQLWLNGGEYNGASYLGMQTLTDHIRANGAQNVLVADALGVKANDPSNPNQPVPEASATLENLLTITDPLNRIVYAVHPYQHGLGDESLWDQEFGIPGKSVPVWADEWSAPAGLALGLGSLPDFQVAIDFVNYAQSHAIPICTGAFDVTRFVVSSVAPWSYNKYDNYSPSSMVDGSGTLIYNDFLNNYSRPLTRADAL